MRRVEMGADTIREYLSPEERAKSDLITALDTIIGHAAFDNAPRAHDRWAILHALTDTALLKTPTVAVMLLERTIVQNPSCDRYSRYLGQAISALNKYLHKTTGGSVTAETDAALSGTDGLAHVSKSPNASTAHAHPTSDPRYAEEF